MKEKGTAIKAVVWSGIERISVQGISFVLSLIIARLLTPADYGVVAMLSIFLAISSTLVDAGFSNALIQKNNPTQEDYSTVFYFNLAIGVVMYLGMYFSAPFIAEFYSQPILTDVTRIISFNLLINSINVVQRAKLTINLNFKNQAIASISSMVVGGVVGLYMAFNGYGVWSLVFQSVISSIVSTVILWILAHWVPSWSFSLDSFKSLFGYGSKILLAQLSHTTFTNLYNVIIGKVYKSSDLGFFNRGQSMALIIPNNLANIIGRVFFPSICRVSNDENELKSIYYKYLNIASFVIMPLMTGLSVLAGSLVYIILGEKWMPAVPVMRILCIAYMFEFVLSANFNVLSARGKSNLVLVSEILKKIIGICILLVMLKISFIAISYGILIYSILDIIITNLFIRRTVSITLKGMLLAVYKNIFASLLMVALILVVSFIFGTKSIFTLVGGIVIGGLSYILIAKYMKLEALSWLSTNVLSKINHK